MHHHRAVAASVAPRLRAVTASSSVGAPSRGNFMAACGVPGARPRRKQLRAARMVPQATEGDNKSGGVSTTEAEGKEQSKGNALEELADTLGVGLGPIAMSYQDDKDDKRKGKQPAAELGPIGLSFNDGDSGVRADDKAKAMQRGGKGSTYAPGTTEEWERKHVDDKGRVDLWLEDDFNAASRLPGGKAGAGDAVNIENTAWVGDEYDDEVPTYNIKITDPVTGQVFDIQSPEDRYILFEAEAQGVKLQNACRNGCCTQCAVKVTKGEVYQPQALGISQELRDQGYALLCVAYPDTDCEMELQDPEEVYLMQFGKAFEAQATDKNSASVERDDFALELADMDE